MYEYKCTVDRVVDGDTIDVTLDLGFSVLYKTRVRLFGIDTPESRTRNKDEKARGKMSAAFLKMAVEGADTVVIRTKLRDSKGKFGRVLGEIFVSPDAVGHEISENVDRSSDGLVSINDILIEEGHAYEYDGGKKKAFVAEIETEKAAKKEDLVDKPAEEISQEKE